MGNCPVDPVTDPGQTRAKLGSWSDLHPMCSTTVSYHFIILNLSGAYFPSFGNWFLHENLVTPHCLLLHFIFKSLSIPLIPALWFIEPFSPQSKIGKSSWMIFNECTVRMTFVAPVKELLDLQPIACPDKEMHPFFVQFLNFSPYRRLHCAENDRRYIPWNPNQMRLSLNIYFPDICITFEESLVRNWELFLRRVWLSHLPLE